MFASSEEVQELLAGLASIFWGIIAILTLFAFAYWRGSVLGVGLAALAAGVTYLFQELQRQLPESRAVQFLGLVPVVIWLIAFLCTVVGV